MTSMISNESVFGTAPDGSKVFRYVISNGGTTASILTWGATLQDFRLNSVDYSLVLGGERFEDYLEKYKYFGAIVGRVANRISCGSAELLGKILTLDKNEGGKTFLHGGHTGSGEQNWKLEFADDTSCKLSLRLNDGDAGFPGNLILTANYFVDDAGALNLKIEGTTDAITFCSPAHHSYWNLSNEPDVSKHVLWIEADNYLPIDADKIPLGAQKKVSGSRFDFRYGRILKQKNDEVLDHNFCLNTGKKFRRVCVLSAKDLQLQLETDAVGLQVYDGDHLDIRDSLTHSGKPYRQNAGLAIEPQNWPDAPNNSHFPSIILKPGEVFTQNSKWHVTKKEA